MGRMIEVDAILVSLRESRDRANVWLSDCREYGSNMTERAEQAVMTFNECILRVKGAPTVDAVPVVRCKDCIRFRPDDDVWGWCTVSGKMRCKDYCSYGVREDGDDEQTKKPE